MSDKDHDLSLEDLGELDISNENEDNAPPTLDEGIDLNLQDELPSDDAPLDEFIIDTSSFDEESNDDSLTLDPDGGEEFSLSEEDEEDEDEEDAEEDEEEESTSQNLGELDLPVAEDLFSSNEQIPEMGLEEFSLESEGNALSEDPDSALTVTTMAVDAIDLSEDAKKKLKEIDAIMDLDASQAAINVNHASSSLDDEDDAPPVEASEPDENYLFNEESEESLEGENVNLDSLNFSAEVREEVKTDPKKVIKREETSPEQRPVGPELREISGAYAIELERTQATIANLRADREELLARIQTLEEEKLLHNRQTLNMRAELDEKKIELSIIRKKLNEEISELRDRMKLHDERRLILEEKNKQLLQELDKAGQRNKLDIKRVQMRERELEQRLELLKADAETQIRNRDLKILELKRKIDAMEFDMESISSQEKRSVESRFELEDKLEKAIKTLRNAISVLEDDSDRAHALSALKKNIDM